jgi:hypothetical protein
VPHRVRYVRAAGRHERRVVEAELAHDRTGPLDGAPLLLRQGSRPTGNCRAYSREKRLECLWADKSGANVYC